MGGLKSPVPFLLIEMKIPNHGASAQPTVFSRKSLGEDSNRNFRLPVGSYFKHGATARPAIFCPRPTGPPTRR